MKHFHILKDGLLIQRCSKSHFGAHSHRIFSLFEPAGELQYSLVYIAFMLRFILNLITINTLNI